MSREGGDRSQKADLSQTSHPIVNERNEPGEQHSGTNGVGVSTTPVTLTSTGGMTGNPLKILNDINMQINLVKPLELNEIQTTASLMKIRAPDEIHKYKMTKKGPTGIF